MERDKARERERDEEQRKGGIKGSQANENTKNKLGKL